jgi:itaconate CoA-transferase
MSGSTAGERVGPLSDIMVVAVEQAVAAPFATRQLADLGARVLKIERPEVGDFARGYDENAHGLSSYFAWLNRGKESVALDLKDADDVALIRTMISRADVFLQNLVPGAASRLGLDPAVLREERPELITCSISGYGNEGPARDRKAYDLLVQCEAGLLSVTGDGDHPAKCGISIADIAAGMYAYTGVLTALIVRSQSGHGTHVDVAMIDALGEWMMQPYLYSLAGHPPVRTGTRHASIAPYGPYRAGDGRTVFIGVQNEREWANLCERVLGAPDLVEDERFSSNSRRVAANRDLTELIEQALVRWTADEVEELLDELGIAAARMRSVTELADHPQLVARDRWRQAPSTVGPVPYVLPPASLSGIEPIAGSIPAMGEHTSAVRTEFSAGVGDRRQSLRRSTGA